MSNIYKDHFLSLVAYAKSVSAKMATTYKIPAPVYINLDAHAQLDSLPDATAICTQGYALHLDGKFIEVFVMFGISTYQDQNLVLHAELMDVLLDSLLPETNIPVLHQGTTGIIKATTHLTVVNPLIVEPTSRTDTRSLQLVMVKLLSGKTY